MLVAGVLGCCRRGSGIVLDIVLVGTDIHGRNGAVFVEQATKILESVENYDFPCQVVRWMLSELMIDL